MIPEKYTEVVEHYLRTFSGDKELAQQAFTELFELIDSLVERGRQALEEKNALEFYWTLAEIQQIFWGTPLRCFLPEFTQDVSLFVRMPAKAILYEENGAFRGDRDVEAFRIASGEVACLPKTGRFWIGYPHFDRIIQSSLHTGLNVPAECLKILV